MSQLFLQRNTAKTAVFLCALLFMAWTVSGCREKPVHVDVDNYLEFLEVSPQQEVDVRAMFESVRDIVEEYNDRRGFADNGVPTSRIPISSDSLFTAKFELIKRISPIVAQLFESLDEEQRLTFSRTELYYLYSETRREVASRLRKSLKRPYERRILPGRVQPAGDKPDLTGLAEQWTVFFGLYNPKSIDKIAQQTFPASVQATLMDSSLLEREKKVLPRGAVAPVDFGPLVEMRVMLSSRLHPNYVDLARWVVFLELPDGSQIEPVRIVKRDRSWFENRGLLFSKRIPEFLSSSDQFQRFRRRRGSMFEGGRLTQYEEYYQLFFPAAVNGVPLISPETRSITLVFLQEIGSRNRARGVWKFAGRT